MFHKNNNNSGKKKQKKQKKQSKYYFNGNFYFLNHRANVVAVLLNFWFGSWLWMVDEGVGRHEGSLDCLRREAENINNKLHIEEKLGSEQKCPAYWAKIIELIDVTQI